MTQSDRLKEVLSLIEETGDRVVVLPEDRDPYVLMDIASYRSLLQTAAQSQKLGELTERELLDRINQQIAEWREAREKEMADYELSEFAMDDSESTQQAHRQPMANPEAEPAEEMHNGPIVEKFGDTSRQQPDLPIVEDDPSDEQEEYHLEPLS